MQDRCNRRGHICGFNRIISLTPAFCFGHFHEQKAFIGKVAIERRLGDLCCLGDIIHACTLKTIAQKDVARADQNLIKLAAFFDAGRNAVGHEYASPLDRTNIN